MGVFRQKLRPVRGTRVRTAKLEEEDIPGIRLWYSQGESLQFIADCYSALRGCRISKQQIHRIVKGQDWKWVTDPKKRAVKVVEADADAARRQIENVTEDSDIIGAVL